MSYGITITKKDENENSIPDLDGTFKILYRAYEKGLLVISVAGNVLRIQPPLNIDPVLFQKGFDILDQSIEEYKSGLIPDEVLSFQNGW